jgi:predicted GNAT family acetyltransferase
MKPNPVRNNTQLHRFEMHTPGGLAIADYRIAGSLMTIFYTEVPLALRGRGYGCQLVCGALQEARRLNLKVEPECGFVRGVINDRPEFKDLLV